MPAMLEKWEIAYFPFEKDSRRYKVRLRCPETDLKGILQSLPVNCGRPFVTLSQEYNWAFYVYDMSDPARSQTIEILKGLSQNGTVVNSSSLIIEKELPPMLEDVLEAAANTLNRGTQGPSGSSPSSGRPTAGSSTSSLSLPTQDARTTPPDASASLAFETIPLNPHYTFEEFIVGPNNRFTHAAAQAVAENPGHIYNPFFIYGGVGLGKTHLMQAIGNSFQKKSPNSRVFYISSEKFMSQVIEAIRTGTINRLRDNFRSIDMLMIDDIQFLSDSESTQEEFFHVFNTLHEAGRQILITSDRPPKLLASLEDRLRSRFEWGLITDLKLSNLETRAAILRKKCEALGLSLDEESLLYIAEKIKSNIRVLEGTLKKIHAYVNLTHENANINFIKQLVGEIPESDAPLGASLKTEQAVPQPQGQEQKAKTLPPVSTNPAASRQAPAAPKQNSGGLEELSAVLSDLTPKSTGQEPHPATQKPGPFSQPVKEFPKAEPIPKLAAREPIKKEEIPPKAAEPKKPPEPAAAPAPAKAPDQTIQKAPAPDQSPQKKEEAPASSAGPEQARQTEGEKKEEETDPTLRPVSVVFFYPKGKETELSMVRQKFQDVIKKHKLKIRLSIEANKPYDFDGPVNFSSFPKECKAVHCSMALVLGLPDSQVLSEDDFAGSLSAELENEKIGMQFIPWSELSKDYRYLNCALDLSLSV